MIACAYMHTAPANIPGSYVHAEAADVSSASQSRNSLSLSLFLFLFLFLSLSLSLSHTHTRNGAAEASSTLASRTGGIPTYAKDALRFRE
jgi:hypothetical protein